MLQSLLHAFRFNGPLTSPLALPAPSSLAPPHTVTRTQVHIFFLLVPAVLLVPPHPLRLPIWFALTTSLYFWILTGDNWPQLDPWAIYSQVGAAHWGSFFAILLRAKGGEVEKSSAAIRVTKGSGDGKMKPAVGKDMSNAGVWEKFKWAADRSLNPRGIGYVDEVLRAEDVARRRDGTGRFNGSKGLFFGTLLAELTMLFFINDALSTALVLRGWGADSTFQHRLVNTWIKELYDMTGFWQFSNFLNMLCVAFGSSTVWEWRPLFGSWREAYSVGRFWGKVWHQTVYIAGATPILCLITWWYGVDVEDKGKVKELKRSAIVRALVVVGAFAGSAVWHVCGAYGNTRTDGGYLRFFTAQVLCVMMEAVLVELFDIAMGRAKIPTDGKEFGVVERRAWEKCIGYVWTALWLGVSGMFIYEQQWGNGMILNTTVFLPLIEKQKKGI